MRNSPDGKVQDILSNGFEGVGGTFKGSLTGTLRGTLKVKVPACIL